MAGNDGREGEPGGICRRGRCAEGRGARSVTTYIIVGHPDSEERDVERSIRFAHRCGTRVLLSEFSPVPGTVDGEKCRPWADLAEPLSHNKTAFALRRFGVEAVNRLKQLTHELNGNLPPPAG